MGKSLHKNLVHAIVDGLYAIFNQDQQANQVVPQLLRSDRRWGSRDRRFIAESIYEIVRWYRWYYELLGRKPQEKADWWQLFGVYWLMQGNDLPQDWSELELLDSAKIRQQAESLKDIRKIRESIPDWLDELGEKELGNQWEKTLKALNQPAQVCLRINTLKSNRQQVQKALAKQQIVTKIHEQNSLLLAKRQKVTHSKAYQQGWFEVQDFSSQQVAPFLGLSPNMRVIDACAGAGGKTLHLAALMNNTGKLTALDVEANKLRELKKRSQRAGVKNLAIQVIDSPQVIENIVQTADRVLLDAPCTGLGVLRRNPDAKWKLSPDFVQKIQTTQQEILQEYSRMCKLGGKLVYATCSILPSENEQQVATFLESVAGQDFRLIKDQTILPQDQGFDGFYMALLERVKGKS